MKLPLQGLLILVEAMAVLYLLLDLAVDVEPNRPTLGAKMLWIRSLSLPRPRDDVNNGNDVGPGHVAGSIGREPIGRRSCKSKEELIGRFRKLGGATMKQIYKYKELHTINLLVG